MVLSIIEVIFVFLTSFLIIKNENKKYISLLGTVGSAYIIGICFSIIVTVLRTIGLVQTNDTTALELIGYLGIALGIPLLLFSSNVKYVFKLSGKIFISYVLLVIAVVIVCIGGFLVFTKNIPNGDILTGMAAGLYSGGTTNLNAVAGFFRLDQQTIFMANLSDMIFGGLFYIFLVFCAKPLVGKILKKGTKQETLTDIELTPEDKESEFSFKSPGLYLNTFLSLLIVILSAGVGYILYVAGGSKEGALFDYLLPAILIGTAALGIAASFVPRVSRVKENSTMGQFFVTVFSCAIASMFNFANLSVVTLKIFAFYACVTVFVFVIHMILCKVFRVDAETMIVTSTAGIYGPAFIPGVVKAIGAEYLLAGGLITGSLGYAIGTFLGIAIVWICRLIG